MTEAVTTVSTLVVTLLHWFQTSGWWRTDTRTHTETQTTASSMLNFLKKKKKPGTTGGVNVVSTRINTLVTVPLLASTP